MDHLECKTCLWSIKNKKKQLECRVNPPNEIIDTHVIPHAIYSSFPNIEEDWFCSRYKYFEEGFEKEKINE